MDIESTIADLLREEKGILAADESQLTIEKRFRTHHISCSEDSRRDYREMLFSTPDLEDYISGIILCDETLRQYTREGFSFPELLNHHGIIPGIKVDRGTFPLPQFPGEKLTQGLDGLRERLIEYRELGAKFTKWRAVISIGESTPSRTCIETNATSLALFAVLSQEIGLVPIVEPEVLMVGQHTIEHCEQITTFVLKTVFEALVDHRVLLEQMILKTGMILPGSDCPEQENNDAIAEKTMRCLRRTVPAAVPGIVFLSGGQSEVDSTNRLHSICQIGESPWKISYSFGRALQSSAMKSWKGDWENAEGSQTRLLLRAKYNSEAISESFSKQFSWT